MSSLFVGFLAASMHVISGPDHLAAVTPLVVETNKKAWKIGFFWGLGHIVGMLSIGVLLLIFKDLIPVESISNNSERFVGIMLIGIGLWSFYRLFNEKKEHSHPHTHTKDNELVVHIHKHSHDNTESKHTHSTHKSNNIITSFGIGFVHGLAGVAHFLLLLPVLSFATKAESVFYIVGFAIGAVLSMSIYAYILSKLSELSKNHNKSIFFKGIRFSSGLFAIIIGVYWLFLTN